MATSMSSSAVPLGAAGSRRKSSSSQPPRAQVGHRGEKADQRNGPLGHEIAPFDGELEWLHVDEEAHPRHRLVAPPALDELLDCDAQRTRWRRNVRGRESAHRAPWSARRSCSRKRRVATVAVQRVASHTGCSPIACCAAPPSRRGATRWRRMRSGGRRRVRRWRSGGRRAGGRRRRLVRQPRPTRRGSRHRRRRRHRRRTSNGSRAERLE